LNTVMFRKAHPRCAPERRQICPPMSAPRTKAPSAQAGARTEKPLAPEIPNPMKTTFPVMAATKT